MGEVMTENLKNCRHFEIDGSRSPCAHCSTKLCTFCTDEHVKVLQKLAKELSQAVVEAMAPMNLFACKAMFDRRLKEIQLKAHCTIQQRVAHQMTFNMVHVVEQSLNACNKKLDFLFEMLTHPEDMKRLNERISEIDKYNSLDPLLLLINELNTRLVNVVFVEFLENKLLIADSFSFVI